ncbi:MAG TPA: sigma-70 family RNA polymerase sigma factor [Planctomycetes bacterium]|nr:sigma-70 family RNA polymerase sigma factor [Planctomycetota bacterium]
MPDDPDLELLLSHGEGFRALARSLVLDQDDVDDLIQDAWLVALERRPDLLSSPRGWMARVLRNLAFQLARKRSRQREVRLAAEALRGSDLEGFSVERLETHRRLVDLVESLAEPYRGLVMLRYFEGLSPRDIAARLGEKPARIRNRLSRALAQLREELDRRESGHRSWPVALIPLCFGGPKRGFSPVAVAMTAALLVVVSVLSFSWRQAEPDGSLAPLPPVATTKGEAMAETSIEPAIRQTGEPPAPIAVRPEPSPAWTLRGAVTDLEGRPVVGAAVSFAPEEPSDRVRRFDLARFGLREPEVTVSTTTGADGRFDVSVHGAVRGWLLVRAKGFTMKTAVVEQGTASRVLFTLSPAQWVDAVVLDADGEPLAGVEIDVATPMGDGVHGFVQHVRTGHDGGARWRLDRLGERDQRRTVLERITGGLNAIRQQVRLAKPGYVGRTVSLTRGCRRDANGRLVFRMSPGRVLALTFTGPDGASPPKPLPFVLRMLGGEYRVQAETDTEGRCGLSEVPEGEELWLLVDGRQGLPTLVRGAEITRPTGLWGTRLSIPPTGDVEVAVRLGPGRELRLRVVDAETGIPLAGREVVCIPSGRWLPMRGQSRRARTGSDGRVAFDGLVERPYYVTLDDDSWNLLSEEEGEAIPPGARSLTPSEPGTSEVLVSAVRRGRLKGWVVDTDGAPVSAADVTWVATADDGETSRLPGGLLRSGSAVRTAKDGSFVLQNVPAGAPIRIVAHPRLPWRDTVGAPLTLRPGERREGLRLAVGRGATLILALRDAEGRPVTGVGVSLARPSDSLARRDGPAWHGRSDGDGVVVFRGLPDGRFRIAVEDLRDRGLYVQRSFRAVVEIEDGRPARVRVPLRAFLDLPVTLVDSRGHPLPHRLAMAIPETIDGDDRRRVSELIPRVAGVGPGSHAETLAHVLSAEAARTNRWGEASFRLPAGRSYRIVVLDGTHSGRTLASVEPVEPRTGAERVTLQVRPASDTFLDELGLPSTLR